MHRYGELTEQRARGHLEGLGHRICVGDLRAVLRERRTLRREHLDVEREHGPQLADVSDDHPIGAECAGELRDARVLFAAQQLLLPFDAEHHAEITRAEDRGAAAAEALREEISVELGLVSTDVHCVQPGHRQRRSRREHHRYDC